MMRILFVCTGNTCRSPMAEGILRKLAAERKLKVEVSSAGVAAVDGLPISKHAQGVLADQGIQDEISSKRLSADLVEWADIILTLTGAHRRYVIQSFPEAVEKTYILKEYVTEDTEQAELRELMAEFEMSKAIGKELEPARLERLRELYHAMPGYDVSDPFGGSREDYDIVAQEITEAINKLLDKLAE